MKKQQLDHVLRAAGRITGEKQFVIIGSQSLHGSYPDLADDIVRSAEVDLIAKREPRRTEWLNVIGQDSPFHEQFGYYADPVDENTAILPKGWKGRLVNLPPGDTEGVRRLCLEPHDLAIAKYVAGREKDRIFTRELAGRGIVTRERLVALLDQTSVNKEVRERILADVARDFDARKTLDESRECRETGRQGPSTPASSTLEEIQAQGRKDWLKLRRQQTERSLTPGPDRTHNQERNDLPKDTGKGVDDEL
jgi:hypothetical protein